MEPPEPIPIWALRCPCEEHELCDEACVCKGLIEKHRQEHRSSGGGTWGAAVDQQACDICKMLGLKKCEGADLYHAFLVKP